MSVLTSNSLHQNTRPISRPSHHSRLGTGSVDGPCVLMKGVRGQHEHHNQQNNDEEENKGLFAVLLLQFLLTYAATCSMTCGNGFNKYMTLLLVEKLSKDQNHVFERDARVKMIEKENAESMT